MSLRSIWKKENRKRLAFEGERKRCDRNWLTHKQRVQQVFDEFLTLAPRFMVMDTVTARRATEESSPRRYGEDSVVLSEMSFFTRRKTEYKNGVSVEIVREKEVGGSLTVHYTEGEAVIQVFFTPPISDQSTIEKMDVLFWYGRNTDDLTISFAEGLISKFLIFCRVESNFQRSSIFERARVRWWRFMDVRNRWQLYGTHIGLLNLWEVTVVTGLIAVAGLLVAVFN